MAPWAAGSLPKTCPGLFRLCTILFGQLSKSHQCENLARQRLVRDFPREKHASYTHSQDFGEIRDVLLICRPTRMLDACDVLVVLSVQEEVRFAHWAVPQFRRVLESARKSTEWFLNCPGIKEMRAMDEDSGCLFLFFFHVAPLCVGGFDRLGRLFWH